MTKHTICHVTTVHSRYDIRIFQKECTSLARKFNVFLVVADGNPDEERNGLRILGTKQFTGRIGRMLVAPWLAYRKILSIPDCTLVHFHDPEFIFVAALLRLHGKKIVYDVHEDVPEDIMLKDWISRPLRRILSTGFRSLEAFFSRRFSLIICSTPYIAGRFRSYNPQTYDIKNYPSIPANPTPSEEKKIAYDVCYIGVISANRGIIPTLDILDKLEARFVLAGPFDSPDFESIIRRHRNWHRVNYLGVLNRSEIESLLPICSIGLVVLDHTPTFVTALPIKLFEYMSFGLAVVASDFAILKDIVTANECGITIPPSQPEVLLDALQGLLATPERIIKMGNRGIVAVKEKYSWEAESLQLLRIYDACLGA